MSSLCQLWLRVELSLRLLTKRLNSYTALHTPCPFPTNFLYLVGWPWACSKGSRVLERFFRHWSDHSRARLCRRYHSFLLPTLLIPLLSLPLLSLLFPVHISQVLFLSIPSWWLSMYPHLVLLYLDYQSGLMCGLWWCSYYKPGVSYLMTSLLREMLLRLSSLSKALLGGSLSYKYDMRPSRKRYEVLIVVIGATTPLLR